MDAITDADQSRIMQLLFLVSSTSDMLRQLLKKGRNISQVITALIDFSVAGADYWKKGQLLDW